MTEVTKQGIMEICSYEGASLSKYIDSQGVQTIGIGATVSEIPDIKLWSWSKELTLPEIFTMFKVGLRKYSEAVEDALHVHVEPHQFDALTSITYNIGIGGMRKSTFMRYINEGRSPRDIRSAIMAWTKNPELVKRRTREANLFEKGEYTNNGTMLLIHVDDHSHKPIYRLSKEISIDQYL